MSDWGVECMIRVSSVAAFNCMWKWKQERCMNRIYLLKFKLRTQDFISSAESPILTVFMNLYLWCVCFALCQEITINCDSEQLGCRLQVKKLRTSR